MHCLCIGATGNEMTARSAFLQQQKKQSFSFFNSCATTPTEIWSQCYKTFFSPLLTLPGNKLEPRNLCWKGRLSIVDLLALTGVGQLIFILKILPLRNLMRRLTVLSLTVQLVFLARAFEPSKPFQPRIIFVAKAWKVGFSLAQGANTVAYFAISSVTKINTIYYNIDYSCQCNKVCFSS